MQHIELAGIHSGDSACVLPPVTIPEDNRATILEYTRRIAAELKVVALAADGEVMAVQHRTYPIYGVQFHPESILTPCGKTMLKNFIKER